VSEERALSLSYAPFPRLIWEDPFWTARVTLTSWQLFQPAYEPDGSHRRQKRSASPVGLIVATPDDLDEGIRALPSLEQAAAYDHLLGHESAVHAAVIRAIVRAYPDLSGGCDFCADDEAEEDALRAKRAPPVRRPEDLRALIGLIQVHVLPVARSGLAYVGFEFDCTWDGEHGLGVLTHKGRVVAVGAGEIAFESEDAKKDARTARPTKGKR
jgi:hypothetical protein